MLSFPIFGNATESPFNDDDWASASFPLFHNSALESVVSDGQGNIYVSGMFRAVGMVAARDIAKWDGANWSPLGAGLWGTVNDLEIAGGEL